MIKPGNSREPGAASRSIKSPEAIMQGVIANPDHPE
jgi:hypothetical protein